MLVTIKKYYQNSYNDVIEYHFDKYIYSKTTFGDKFEYYIDNVSTDYNTFKNHLENTSWLKLNIYEFFIMLERYNTTMTLKELYKTQINFFQNKIKYFNNIYLDSSTTTYFKHNALDQIKYFEQQITYYQTLISQQPHPKG